MEIKTKNREWVKTVAIVFLSVLLLLTFFSRTIQNASLPEVSTAYVTSGTITAKVRGTGTVKANGTFDVVTDETRKILAVTVKAGQEVQTGDVLFILGEGSSEELQAATEELESLQTSYQQTRLTMPDYEDDYIIREDKIQQAQAAADKAEEAMEQARLAMEVNAADDDEDSEYYKARKKLESAEEKYQGTFDDVKAYLKDYLEEASYTLETDASSAKLTHQDEIGMTDDRFDAIFNAGEHRELPTQSELGKLQTLIKDRISALNSRCTELEVEITRLGEETDGDGNPVDNSAKIDECKIQVSSCTEEIDRLSRDGDPKTIYSIVKSLTALAVQRDSCQTEFDRTCGSEAYTSAKASYQEALNEVADLQADYDAAKKANEKTAASTALELRNIAKKIEEAKEKVAKLSGGEENQIVAEVPGIVSEIYFTAGNSTAPDTALCTICVTDSGYSLSFTCTTEQARRLHVGDTATVSNYYWGSMIEATLTSIQNDPKSPQTSKVLTFDLQGDVNVGTELTISVGAKSATYDYVVPASAVRSDSNGTFVLVVEAKSTPLGNFYKAKRVPVDVLAEDDTNKAVSGEFDWSSYVITVSADGTLIKNGDRIRLADNAEG